MIVITAPITKKSLIQHFRFRLALATIVLLCVLVTQVVIVSLLFSQQQQEYQRHLILHQELDTFLSSVLD